MFRYLCWLTISPIGYYPPNVSIPQLVDYQSQRILFALCFDTSAGGILVPEDIIRPKFRYLSWWIISPRGYYPPNASIPQLLDYQSQRILSAQCFDTSAGGLLVPVDIIRPMFRYLCWWTNSPRGYYPPNVSIPQLVDYYSQRILSDQCFDTSAGVLLVTEDISRPMFQFLSWWTISPRGYYPPNVSIPQLVDYQSQRILSAQCFDTSADELLLPEDIIAQGFDTSAGGLLIPEDSIRPMVDTSAGELLVPEDIMRPMFLYLCWWTISPRGYYPPNGRYLCWWTISPSGYYPPNGRYLCW